MSSLLKDIQRRRSLEHLRGRFTGKNKSTSAPAKKRTRQLSMFAERGEGASSAALRAELQVLAKALPLQVFEREGIDPIDALIGYLENGGRPDMWIQHWFPTERARDLAQQRGEGAVDHLRKIAARYDVSVLELLDDSGIDIERWYRETQPDPWTNKPRRGTAAAAAAAPALPGATARPGGAARKSAAKKRRSVPTLTGTTRSVVAILKNAREDGDSAAHFGVKGEKAALRKLVKAGLAKIVREEPKGPEGPQLWAKLTAAGIKAYGER